MSNVLEKTDDVVDFECTIGDVTIRHIEPEEKGRHGACEIVINDSVPHSLYLYDDEMSDLYTLMGRVKEFLSKKGVQ